MKAKFFFNVNITVHVKDGSIAFIFQQHEFNDFGRTHGQYRVYGGTPQCAFCNLREHDSGDPVPKQPVPSQPVSWEPTWLADTCECTTSPENLQRGQNLRGKWEFTQQAGGHIARVRGERRVGNTETSNPASGAGADPALTNSGLLGSSAVEHHQGLGMRPYITYVRHFKKGK